MEVAFPVKVGFSVSVFLGVSRGGALCVPHSDIFLKYSAIAVGMLSVIGYLQPLSFKAHVLLTTSVAR
jgi:hypothetical protein